MKYRGAIRRTAATGVSSSGHAISRGLCRLVSLGLILLVGGVPAGCGRSGYGVFHRTATGPAGGDDNTGAVNDSDRPGDTLVDPVPGPPRSCSWTGPFTWSTPVPLAGLNSAEADDIDPRLSDNGLTLYYASTRSSPGNQVTDSKLFVVTRMALTEPFLGPPSPLWPSSGYAESVLTTDRTGLLAVVSANWPDGSGEFDLWSLSRSSTANPWQREDAVLEPLSSDDSEFDPWLSLDGLRVYFTAVLPSDPTGNQSVAMSSRPSPDLPFGPPAALENINSDSNDNNPTLTADEEIIVFASKRAGDDDLYYAVRESPHAFFDAPQPLTELNEVSRRDNETFLSPDGCTLYVAFNQLTTGWVRDLHVSQYVDLSGE